MLRDVLGTLAYPVAGEAAERPLLAGWVLVSFGFLVPVLPLIPVLGYLVRVLVASAAGSDGPPPFVADPLDLVRLGAGATVVCIAYLAVPVVALVVTVTGLVDSPRVPRGFDGALVFFSGTTVVLGLSLLASYLLPVALAAYGRERRLRAAFDYRAVSAPVRSSDVLVAWAAALTLAAVGAAAAGALLDVSRLGPVLAALVVAYTAIVASRCLGLGIARAER